ncbi:MAG: META domain-containing protein [Pseudomonadota bacterium]
MSLKTKFLLGALLLGTAACGENQDGESDPAPMTMYACGAQWIDVAAEAEGARVVVGADVYEMLAVPAASGARYISGDESAPAAEFWERGDEAQLTLADESYPTCQRSDALYSSYLPIEAAADDGSWSVLLNAEDGEYTSAGATTSFGLSSVERDREAWIVETDAGLSLAVQRGGCDGEGSVALSVTSGGETSSTCSKEEPMGLNGTYTSMIGENEVQLTFIDENSFGAYAGCNRMSGGYERDGDSIIIGDMAMTRMACMGPVVDAEQALTEFLSGTLTIEAGPDGEANGFTLTSGDTALTFEPKADDE